MMTCTKTMKLHRNLWIGVVVILWTILFLGFTPLSMSMEVSSRLDWATYLGSSGSDWGCDVVVDKAGDLLVTGQTSTADWATGGVDTIAQGGMDAFVAKFNPDGNLIWSTYLGGSQDDMGNGIALDNAGNILVSGRTSSQGWVSGGFDTTYHPELYDAANYYNTNGFVAKLTPTGRIIWSTYLPGFNYNDYSNIAVDLADNVLVTGTTSIAGWATGGYDTSLSGIEDAFVVKISPEGKHLWSSYLGGDASDGGINIATDPQGNILVAGFTYPSNNWVSGKYNNQSDGTLQGFVAQLSPTGQHLWSTYIGSRGKALAIAADCEGNVWVGGDIFAADWASGGADIHYEGNGDGFVAQFSNAGDFHWSTYLGGDRNDIVRSITIDDTNCALVSGHTESAGWLSQRYNNSSLGYSDGFIVKQSPSGNILWGAYFGGSGADSIYKSILDGKGHIYTTGVANSSDLARKGYKNSALGGWDAFVARLTDLSYIPNWTWMKGSSTINQPGEYGILNTPNPANIPGGRHGAALWRDRSGALWLFGGNGYDAAGNTGYLNDLWRHDPLTDNWSWIKGTSTVNQPGVYGTQGTSNTLNTPGARFGMATWTDRSGAFWIFGGQAYDAAGNAGYLNDLWKFDPATGNWTWIKGPSLVNQAGDYGTQGIQASTNTPGARAHGVSWIDNAGALWLFGGMGYDKMGTLGTLNDLWKFDPAQGNWIWIKGASVSGQPATYGSQSLPDPANVPGGRYQSTAWCDASGLIWLFGGNGHDAAGKYGELNDLWNFDPLTGNWTWIKGASTVDQAGSYGVQGTPDPANTPGGRDGAVLWGDVSGALWLFGGFTHQGSLRFNDLWKFDPVTGNWTWIKGAATAAQGGNYGTRGVSNPANIPGSRDDAAWVTSADSLWLFGGYGEDAAGDPGFLSDLWNLDPVTGNWTWISGTSTKNQAGTYGTLSTPNPTSNPGARAGAARWVDSVGALYLYGGQCFDTEGNAVQLNDLWRHDPLTGDWSWIKGSSTLNQPGVYGTQGTPAPDNTPGARLGAATWLDRSGKFWLLGGIMSDKLNNTYFNDMWMFDPVTGNWTWIKGASTGNQPGNYGTQGKAAPTNSPGARSHGVSWVDRSGTFWLFGGVGYDQTGTIGALNDLWRFDPATNNWTWIKGSSVINQAGVYGTQGVSVPTNTPGARYGAVAYADCFDQLWLFGGNGHDSAGTPVDLNDLWKFDTVTGNWTWVKGASTGKQTGIYGTQGAPDVANTPGGRDGAALWGDGSGSLWLFGGFDHNGSVRFNDLWKFDPVTGNWTWLKGSSTVNQPGIYGTKGMANPSNTPGARSDAVWGISADSLLLYGGFGYDAMGNQGFLNDLWLITTPSTSNNQTLAVISDHGNPFPSMGTHVYTSGTQVLASVASPVIDTTVTARWVCTGWKMTGNKMATGSGTSVTLAVDAPTTLTWLWKKQYMLTASVQPAGAGIVTLSDGLTPAHGTWHDAQTTASLRVKPNAGYIFTGWSGDLSGAGTTRTLEMKFPCNVTANFIIPPSFSTQPTSQTIDQGGNVSFSVVANGSPALTYQWFKGSTQLFNGVKINGVNTSTLQLVGVTDAEEGDYSCRVTNSGGTVWSKVAVLNVLRLAQLSVTTAQLNYLDGSIFAVDVLKGGTPTMRSVVLTNTGEKVLTFTGGGSGTPGLALSGVHANDYSISNITPSTTTPLAPGASVVVTVRFAPTEVVRTLGMGATLTVTTDSPINPTLTITLLGDAVPVDLSRFSVE